MEKKPHKWKFEAFITEVNTNFYLHGRDHYPVFKALQGVHFTMYAEDKKEVAEKVAEIISAATGESITHAPEPYLSSVLEWTFDTKNLDIKFGIEKMS